MLSLVAFQSAIPFFTFRLASAEEKRTAYVHLFEWKWKDIALECENFLGPNGFAAVQVSPPQEHAVLPNHAWYQRYQPVSYQLVSRSGNREEFVDMVRRCKAAGVDIYVDAVINHMTWINRSGLTRYGNAGTPFGEYLYAGTYSPWDFHRCGRNNDLIANYNDRWEVQNCNLGIPGEDLADLKTESEYVRSRIAGYLNDLLDIGVAGFRIDAAKHMPVGDLQAILGKLKRPAFFFSEVIFLGNDNDPHGEPIRPREYMSIGNAAEFRYSRDISRVFKHGELSWLSQFGEAWGFMPSTKAMAFIDNHDNQRGHGAGGDILTHKDTWDNRYVLANIFMLAWPYGYPQIMSSYRFSEHWQGPPSDAHGNTKSIYDRNLTTPNCGGEWVCEHRWPAVARMVRFRNYTDDAFFTTKWWGHGNQIAFARGNKGFVAMNKTSQTMDRWFDTGLPPGQYCDIVSGEMATVTRGCTGQTITVQTNGWARVVVKPFDAAVIYGGMKL